MAVTMLGAFGTLVISSVSSDTPTPPAATFLMEPVVGADSLDVRHVGGAFLESAGTRVILNHDGGQVVAPDSAFAEEEWGPGDTLTIDLGAHTLVAGEKLTLFVVDDASGKTVGVAYATVPSADTSTAIRLNDITATFDFESKPLTADGVTFENVVVKVASTHGLALVDTVTVDLSDVNGPRALELFDNGVAPDGSANDGEFTARFVVGNYTFDAYPGNANESVTVTLRDVLGHTTIVQSEQDEPERPMLWIQTPVAPKVAAGIKYRGISSSDAIGSQGYLNLTNFTFRNARALDNDLLIVRVSDLVTPTLAWTASVQFNATGTVPAGETVACAAPGITEIVLRLDTPDDTDADRLVYRPTDTCWPIGPSAILNLADLSRSWDENGDTGGWELVEGDPDSLLYSKVGLSKDNEAYISFFGDTVSASPSLIGLGQADFGWSGDDDVVVGAPTAPRSLTATRTSNAVTLNWLAPLLDGGAPITQYEIWMGTSSNGETLLTTIATANTYQVTGLTNGQPYYFKVRAINAGAFTSPDSNEATATPAAAPGIPVPTAVADVGQVQLTWSSVANNGNAILNHKIYRGTTALSQTLLATLSGAANTSFLDDEAADGTTYYYRVSATNTVGETSSAVVSDTTPGLPGVPGAFGVSAGDAKATLTWTAAAQNGRAITAYKVYRDNVLIATLGNVLTYEATGLTNGVAYSFQVSAVNAVGEGPRTSASSVTPLASVTKPSAPQTLTGTADNRTVTLNWLAPSDTGGSPITKYRVYMGTVQATKTLLADTADGNTLTYTATGLTNGTLYWFNVTAWNAQGESLLASNDISGTPTGAPDPITGLAAVSGNRTAQLTWTLPTNVGGSALTEVRVYHANNQTLAATLAATATSHTVTGLTNGTTYSFYAIAYNARGAGASSGVTVTPTGAPDPITGLAAVRGNTTADLTWTLPVNVGGSALTAVRIVHANNQTVAATLAPSATSHTVTGLVNGTTYSFYAVAVNARGEGASTGVTVTPTGAPNPITSLAAVAANMSAQLTWSLPLSDGGSPLTAVRIVHANNQTVAATLAPTATSHTVTGLANGTTYAFYAIAVNARGEGASSGVTVTPVGAPYPPTGLTATSAPASVVLNWALPLDNGGSALTAVRVHNVATGATVATLAASATSYTVTGLTNGQAYTFQVIAVNAAGASSGSNPATATPYGAPSAPSVAAVGGVQKITLTITAPSDTGGAPIANYHIYMSTVSGSTTFLASTGGANTTFVVNSLTPEVTYYFTVRAENAQTIFSSASAETSAVPTGHTYASTTITDLNGGTVTNAANYQSSTSAVATLTEVGSSTSSVVVPLTQNERDFNTSAGAWTAYGVTAGKTLALSYASSGGNPGGGIVATQGGSGNSQGNIEYVFTPSAAAQGDIALTFSWKYSGGNCGSARYFYVYLVAPDNTTLTQIGTQQTSCTNGAWNTFSASAIPQGTIPDATAGYRIRVLLNTNGNGESLTLDNVYLTYTGAGNHRFGKSFSISGIPTGSAYTLEVRARTLANAENLLVQDGAGSTIATVSSGTMTTYSVVVTPSGGAYTLRLVDASQSGDTSASTWEVDYIRVVTSP